MTTASDEPTPVMYVCEHCGKRFVSNTAYEADKPNGYYVDVRRVDGGTYSTHTRTSAPAFFCSHDCLVEGMRHDLPSILKPTTPDPTN